MNKSGELHRNIFLVVNREQKETKAYSYVCCIITHFFCPLQNGVDLPEDAVLGSGGGPLSSSNLCQAVPGALPYAHQRLTSTSTEVRSRYEKANTLLRGGNLRYLSVPASFKQLRVVGVKWANVSINHFIMVRKLLVLPNTGFTLNDL